MTFTVDCEDVLTKKLSSDDCTYCTVHDWGRSEVGCRSVPISFSGVVQKGKSRLVPVVLYGRLKFLYVYTDSISHPCPSILIVEN